MLFEQCNYCHRWGYADELDGWWFFGGDGEYWIVACPDCRAKWRLQAVRPEHPLDGLDDRVPEGVVSAADSPSLSP